MPNFQGQTPIILQPNDLQRFFSFEFPQANEEGANDGFLPYGVFISSCNLTAWKEGGTQATDLIDSYHMDTTSDCTVIIVSLNYPTTSGAGRYSLRFILTLTNGSQIEADFARVHARNLGYNGS